MSKKEILEDLDTLLKNRPERPKRGRPIKLIKEITKSSQEGTKEKETRATFIVNEELLTRVKAIAYDNRVLIKDIINKALQEVINEYEKKDIKPIAKKKLNKNYANSNRKH